MKDETKKHDQTKKKKPYQTPKLMEFGSVREFTQTISTGTGMDGGTAPKNTMASCIADASPIEEHRFLIGDRVCQDAYRETIFKTVKPGDVVVDLGTGSGIHTFFACQAGAKKVYSIECGSLVHATRRAAEMNGFADRIEFIQDFSDKVELPEKADVIISNIGFLNTLRYMPDAAKRFLKKGGKMIPGAIQNFFVPVDYSAYYAERVNFWRQKHYGLDFSAFAPMAVNGSHIQRTTIEDFLAKPQGAPRFDLMIPAKKSDRWTFNYTASRDGVLNGILCWYTFRLSETASISTRPPLSLSQEVWSQPFLPLNEPVKVSAGEMITVEISYYFENEMDNPIWTWKVHAGGSTQEQSTFIGLPMALN